MRILLTGGGTGGHLTPLVAVAENLKHKLGPEADFLYLGSGAELEKRIMQEAGIKMKFVLSGKLRRYFSPQNIIDIFKVPIGILQSLGILFFYTPDVVFSKGGYVAVPVVIAAWIYRIPVLIHESDSVPGIANQFLGKLASRVAVAYPEAEQYFSKEKVAMVGNLVRFQVTEGDPIMIRKHLGFTESKKTIFVFGGSQGAMAINKAIVKILPELLPYYQVIHQTGEKNYDEVISDAAFYGIKAKHEGYYPLAFMNANEIRDAFAVSDLVISRAGATSISEIAANGKASILIPLDSSANDHQRANAYALAKIGAAMVLEEGNLGQHLLREKIDELMKNDDERIRMSEKVKPFYHPKATDIVSNSLIELARA